MIPSNKGTIGLCSLNLYKALSEVNEMKCKVVIVHKFNNGFHEFENCEWCVSNSSSKIKKIFSGIHQIFWLKKIKLQFKPDITVSTLQGCSTINVLSGGNDKKIGIFHSPHMQFKQKGRFEYLIVLFCYNFIYPFLDKLYCVSEETKNSIINSFKVINKKKIEVVYNIHDTKKIISLADESIVEEIEIFKNPVLLFCGRLDLNKAPERLLQGFIKSDVVSKYHLVYMGRDAGNLCDNLHTTAVEHGISDKIHYIGAKNNPYKYMKNSVALVSTSYSEGLPGVLIESLLLGIPVITTNSSEGVWEIISCHDKYDKKMKNYYISKEGIITSNLAFYDKQKEVEDIINLAKAINYLNNSNFDISNFEFEQKVTAENIIPKYLNI